MSSTNRSIDERLRDLEIRSAATDLAAAAALAQLREVGAAVAKAMAYLADEMEVAE